ncbi:MAG: cation diffusion facilitator family transporter, partial [Muribaculaceae bacterium]|nr:cation diffusion facilitator family transporter [Muribaculaceae bacterium]
MRDTFTDREFSDEQAVRLARHVTWVGFWMNALLGVIKVLAGVFGRSAAMVADGVHSFSDFVTDIIVLIFVGIGRRKANVEYQYGHGKFETFATMLLALILGVVGVLFFVDGAEKTLRAMHGEQLPAPGWIAMVTAVASIAAKEWLYRYTRRAGEKIHSAVVVANAWHHRSDAFSSLATLAGIGGAMFFGVHWRVLDPVAAMVVRVFIVMVSIRIG